MENGACGVDKSIPGAAAISQKGKWDYLIGVGLACFIGLLNGSLSGELYSHVTDCCLHWSRALQLARLPVLSTAFAKEPSLRC